LAVVSLVTAKFV